MDMFKKSYDIFIREQTVREENTIVVFEITLSNLKAFGEIDEQDFMDRAELLCSLGHIVMISDFQEYFKVVDGEDRRGSIYWLVAARSSLLLCKTCNSMRRMRGH